jgi:hypothetical protein
MPLALLLCKREVSLTRFHSILGCLLAVTAISATAAPVYYGFEGVVTVSTIAGLSNGQTVHYSFVADRSLDAYHTQAGLPTIYEDVVAPDYYFDYFYCEYLGGDAVAIDPPSLYNGTLDYNVGYSQAYPGGGTSILTGSNGDLSGYDYVYAFTRAGIIEDWYVGQTFEGYNVIVGDAGVYDAFSTLTLVSITDTNPIGAVPEPSTVALMALGIAGSGLAARKRKV